MALLVGPNESTLNQEVHNILVIALVFVIGIWVIRISNIVVQLIDLRSAFTLRQIVRYDGFAAEFGEFPLLSRSQFEQLLRSRQTAPSIQMRQAYNPIIISRQSYKTVFSSESKRIAVGYRFDCNFITKVDFLWGVSAASLDGIVRRAANRDHSNASEANSTARSHPQEQRDLEESHTNGEPSNATQHTPKKSETVYAPSEASEDSLPHTPGPLPARLHPLVQSRPSQETLSTVLDILISKHLFQRQQESISLPSGNGIVMDSKNLIPIEIAVDANTLRYNDDLKLYPLVIIHQITEDREVVQKFLERMAPNQQVPHWAVTNISVLQFSMPASANDSPSPVTMKRFIELSDGRIEEMHDIYGLEEHETPECLVCFTDPKDIAFLPCLHCCVCQSCFKHLDKCPICRTPVGSYIRLRGPKSTSVASLSTTPGV
eukprot:TRINITY_DN10340_c0_g1_i1.p1 TRINITY_DN10340_c0_g1~~TRINITY_DN10340_c0_g1_i1.p1  ORF type:complete len:432 (+),score=78.12 TRINITY_DN10340_c0_g1_i1:53-1348(+)